MGARGGFILGVKRTAVAVGNWCAPIYTEPVFYFYGKVASNSLLNPFLDITVKWDKVFANQTLYFQGYAADPKAPSGIVLTQGNMLKVPAMPTFTEVASRIHETMKPVTQKTGTILEGDAITIRLKHK